MNIYILLLVILIILYFYFYYTKSKEPFETNNNLFFRKCYNYNDNFDKYYSYLYDDLFFNKQYYTIFCKIILKYLNQVYNKKLIIGMKHGGHMNELLKDNMNTIAISKSEHVIKLSKLNYPENNYEFIDSYDTNPYIFDENTFTHISIIDNELYFTKNIHSLLYNCYKWVMFKGYLFLQVYNNVNDLKHDFIKINYNSKNRIKYNYSYEFKDFSNKDSFYLIEKLKRKNKERINHHTLYFHDIEYLKYTAKEYGFEYVEMQPLNHYENIIIFQKQ